MFKVFDEAVVNGRKFAILVDDESRTACEAVWDEQNGRWETDFAYPAVGVDSMDVAAELDFDGAEKAGYSFNPNAE